MIKVCSLSLSDSLHCDKYTTLAQLYSFKCKKRLDIPLTLLYTVYVDWVKGKEMTYDEAIEFCTKRMVVMGYAPWEIKEAALKLLGEECAREYEKKYGE